MSHRCVGAWRLEIDSDGMVVWSGGDGGFSLFLSFRSSVSLTLILSVRLDVDFGLLWIFGVDWRSKSAAGTEDQQRQHGGLEIGDDGVVVWSGGDGGFSLFLSFWSPLSLTPILSLRLDVGFGFGLNFLQVQSESFCFFFFFNFCFVLFCFVFFFVLILLLGFFNF